jgi:ubiquinone/menaquinone biosynthesis C-methylase UbiE
VSKSEKRFAFSVMTVLFRIRDLIRPRTKILQEVGLKPGFNVLDFGCGPGAYTVALSRMVGKTGLVYALDRHPMAVEKIEALAARHGLKNVRTLLADNGPIALPDDSCDVVLLYDVFHGLPDPDNVLAQIQRVLKPSGFLSFSDHHMGRQAILSGISGSGRFHLLKKHRWTYTFFVRS